MGGSCHFGLSHDKLDRLPTPRQVEKGGALPWKRYARCLRQFWRM